MTSSPGSSRRAATCSWRNACSSPIDARSGSSVSIDSMQASDQRRNWRRSGSAMPSSSAMTRTGSGAATCSTKSISVPVGTPSSSDRVRLRTRSPSVAIARGVKLACDEAPPPGVLGRVLVQDRAVDLAALAERVVHQDAPARAEPLGVAADLADVVVAAEQPAAGLVAEHGGFGPQPSQDLEVVGSGEQAGGFGVEAELVQRGGQRSPDPTPSRRDGSHRADSNFVSHRAGPGGCRRAARRGEAPPGLRVTRARSSDHNHGGSPTSR